MAEVYSLGFLLLIKGLKEFLRKIYLSQNDRRRSAMFQRILTGRLKKVVEIGRAKREIEYDTLYKFILRICEE